MRLFAEAAPQGVQLLHAALPPSSLPAVRCELADAKQLRFALPGLVAPAEAAALKTLQQAGSRPRPSCVAPHSPPCACGLTRSCRRGGGPQEKQRLPHHADETVWLLSVRPAANGKPGALALARGAAQPPLEGGAVVGRLVHVRSGGLPRCLPPPTRPCPFRAAS